MNHMVLTYAAAGIRVHPLHWRTPQGRCSCGKTCGNNAAKHPLLLHGKDDASSDTATVSEWLTRWPSANWGMVPPPGTIVVDVDPRNNGHIELAELEQRYSPLPTTLTARTGSGGWHYWFAYSGVTRGRLADGVDIKTSTGYVVAPPSVHICGRPYEWVDSDAVSVPAPAWFHTVFDPPRQQVAALRPLNGADRLRPLVRFVADAQEGERSNRLYWASCRALESQLDTTPLIDAAVGIGLTRREAEKTAASAANRRPRKGA